ncbi:hypothetical protein M728_003832 (plasmid) [Ensifer sp. WSM1721]|nr:hypothetical protein [Ensifer sp. WSM1721]
MSSQRKPAKQSGPRFLFELWNAILRVQTRETASLFMSRER